MAAKPGRGSVMTDTVDRQGCGTYLAALLHQAHGEPLCPRCGWAFFDRTGRPAPPPDSFKPVTETEAARNRQVLAWALAVPVHKRNPGSRSWAQDQDWRAA